MQRFRASVLILAAALGPMAGGVTPAAAQTLAFTTAVNAAVQQACLSSTSASLLNTIASTLVVTAASSTTNATYINTQIAASCPSLQTAYQSASAGTLQLSAQPASSVTPSTAKKGNCGFGNGGDDGIPGNSDCEDKNR